MPFGGGSGKNHEARIPARERSMATPSIRRALARRRSSLTLDSNRVAGGADEIPASERLPRTRRLTAPLESVIDATGPGRLKCSLPRAAASVSGFN